MDISFIPIGNWLTVAVEIIWYTNGSELSFWVTLNQSTTNSNSCGGIRLSSWCL